MRNKNNFEKEVELSDRLAIEPRIEPKNEVTRDLPWFNNVENL